MSRLDPDRTTGEAGARIGRTSEYFATAVRAGQMSSRSL